MAADLSRLINWKSNLIIFRHGAAAALRRGRHIFPSQGKGTPAFCCLGKLHLDETEPQQSAPSAKGSVSGSGSRHQSAGEPVGQLLPGILPALP